MDNLMSFSSIEKYRKIFEKKVDKKTKDKIFNVMQSFLERGLTPKKSAEETSKKITGFSTQEILKLTKFEEKDINEIAANIASSGHVAGFTSETVPGPKKRKKKKERKTKKFGEVFTVPEDVFKKFMRNKTLPEDFDHINNFSKLYPKIPVVLENERTGAFMFFRRKPMI